jgi:membrane-associated phospholipid phosphatase
VSEKSWNYLALAIGLIFGTVIPLAVVYALKQRGVIPDIYASRRESRLFPFMGAILSYLVGALGLRWIAAPSIVTALMLCYLGNSVILMVISCRWKISVHASGIAGPGTVLLFAVGAGALPFFILLLPVGWARIRLGAHTTGQVFVGALLTIGTTWIQLSVYLKLFRC